MSEALLFFNNERTVSTTERIGHCSEINYSNVMSCIYSTATNQDSNLINSVYIRGSIPSMLLSSLDKCLSRS